MLNQPVHTPWGISGAAGVRASVVLQPTTLLTNCIAVGTMVLVHLRKELLVMQLSNDTLAPWAPT
jgi:hypothetical protein